MGPCGISDDRVLFIFAIKTPYFTEDMFYLLLESILIYGKLDNNTNILVYTSTEFMNKIKQNHLFNAEKIKFEINNTYNNVDKACKSRLDLFNLLSITNYETIPSVYCYADELGQIFTNLIHNSIQAMEGKGTLLIEIKQTPIPEKDSIVSPFPPTKEERAEFVEKHRYTHFLSISIEDSGPGIPPEIQKKIFEPFFTTKEVGEGTGLGLSICHEIVTGLGGTIEVESVEGGGSTFRVVLPPASGPAKVKSEPVGAPDTSTTRRGRVLARRLRLGDAVVAALRRLRGRQGR